jgi:hypothetical protein
MKTKSRFSIFRILRVLVLVYAGIFIWGWIAADSMAFFPPRPSYEQDAPGLFCMDARWGWP